MKNRVVTKTPLIPLQIQVTRESVIEELREELVELFELDDCCDDVIERLFITALHDRRTFWHFHRVFTSLLAYNFDSTLKTEAGENEFIFKSIQNTGRSITGGQEGSDSGDGFI